jgi:hypothetical protein
MIGITMVCLLERGGTGIRIGPTVGCAGAASKLCEGSVEDGKERRIMLTLSAEEPLWSSGQSSWLHNGDVLCFL